MSLVVHARAFAAELAGYRAGHDAARQLDPAVIAGLREGGFLTCLLPRELGGAELAPAAYIEVLEAIAIGDSATAWCVMTASTSVLLAPYLARPAATAIWAPAGRGSGAPFLAGVFAPGGKLVDGRLTGQWSYASGCRHADWFVVGALAGRRHVVCFVPPRDVRIVDNWDTLGLAGTGSHDLVIEDAAIDPAHVTSVFEPPRWSDSALARMPLFGFLATGIAACGLGIARGALIHVGSKLTAASPSPQLARYAELRAQLDAARAYLLATATMAFDRAHTGTVDGATRGELRLAASHVAQQCAGVVRATFHLGGGASVRAGSPIGAALRDVETLLTHRMVTDRVLPTTARVMLELDAVPPDL
jgi:alkylation response protein AidB-like acyl-CoA dehydrogenase